MESSSTWPKIMLVLKGRLGHSEWICRVTDLNLGQNFAYTIAEAFHSVFVSHANRCVFNGETPRYSHHPGLSVQSHPPRAIRWKIWKWKTGIKNHKQRIRRDPFLPSWKDDWVRQTKFGKDKLHWVTSMNVGQSFWIWDKQMNMTCDITFRKRCRY